MPETEALPCPFCGSAPRKDHCVNRGDCYACSNSECGAYHGWWYNGTWNARRPTEGAETAPPGSVILELCQQIEKFLDKRKFADQGPAERAWQAGCKWLGESMAAPSASPLPSPGPTKHDPEVIDEAFDNYWGTKGDRWNGAMDIKEYSRGVWAAACGYSRIRLSAELAGAALQSQAPGMVWTKEKPKVEGWYWARMVFEGRGANDLGLRYIHPENWNFALPGTHCEFAGPLLPPGDKGPQGQAGRDKGEAEG